MAAPTLLASDVMDQSSAILNDTALTLYSYATQLPYLKKANEDLEQLLLTYGIQHQFKKSTVIDVAAEAKTLILPSDFLLPITLYERADGSTSEDDWVEMNEGDWEDNIQPQSVLGQWSFRRNAINFYGSTVVREVKLYYGSQLGIIQSSSSPEDSYLFKSFLSAKTAEYCARYIGMNKPMADEIKLTESDRAEDNLTHILVGNMQGARKRRGKFTSKVFWT